MQHITPSTLLVLSLASFAALAAFVSCAEEEPDADSSDAVIGGRRDTRHTAVGQIGQRVGLDRVAWSCTGTLIAPSLVLTAAHCVFDEEGQVIAPEELVFQVGGEDLGVLGIDTDRYNPGARGAWHDIATLQLASMSSTRPIPIAIDPPAEGQAATVVGFGVTRATAPHRGVGAGTRRSARIQLGPVGDQELRYASDPRGACYGDSGGPVLAGSGRSEVVIGVTSRGTQVDCLGTDIATRVDAYADWISSYGD